MKTPQEQAEELTNKAAREYYEERCELVNDAVMKIIPLAELIAVAQAAAKEHARNLNDRYPDSCEVCTKIIALRATGKVEL